MKVSSKDSIYHLQKKCFNSNIPFVSYSLPNQKDVNTLIQYKTLPRKLDSLTQVNQSKGFVIAPFFEN
ncbi:MAG TPA: hypothetical protein VHO90_21700, partial [Bacteroidales bacterium]|nr:hypothetical protein [Bacteroidales bacterium]